MPVIDDRYIASMDSYVERMAAYDAASAILRAIPHLMHDMEKEGLIKSLRHRTVFETEAFIVDFIDSIPLLSKRDVEKRHYLIQDMEQ